jgi:hypothetical protein
MLTAAYLEDVKRNGASARQVRLRFDRTWRWAAQIAEAFAGCATIDTSQRSRFCW